MPSKKTALCFIILCLSLFSSSHLFAKTFFYMKQPFPDLEKTWTSADYQATLIALQKIQKSHPDRLPRRGGQYTSAVYKQIISDNNFSYLLDIYTPVEIRRQDANQTIAILRELMKVYFNFSEKEQPYGIEALSLMVYTLRLQEVIFTVTVELWMSFSEEEQQSLERLQGLMETKEAAAALVKSSLQYLSLHTQFNEHDLGFYAFELSTYMPKIFLHLSSENQITLLKTVEQSSQNHPVETVRGAMSKLSKNLNYLLQQKELQLKPNLPQLQSSEKNQDQTVPLSPPAQTNSPNESEAEKDNHEQ